MRIYQVCASVHELPVGDLEWKPCFSTLQEAMDYVESHDSEEINGWKEGINNDDKRLKSHWSTSLNEGYDSYIIWELEI